MYLVGNHELFEGRVLLLQPVGQFDRLIEGHVAIVVSLNQENRRFPFCYVCIRRRGKSSRDGLLPLCTRLIPMFRKRLSLGQRMEPSSQCHESPLLP